MKSSNSLFEQEKIRKNGIRLLKLLCLMAEIIIVYYIAAFLIVDEGSTTRLAFHEFYEQSNIDMAVVGASKVYHGFNPELADSLTGVNTFNMGTASQPVSVTYYYTKELLKNYRPDTLFVDVELAGLPRKIEGGKSTWLVYNHMKGFEKYKMAFAHGDFTTKLATVCSLYRSRENIDLEFIKNNVKAKSTEAYKKYLPESEFYTSYNIYQGKGFVTGSKVNEGYDLFCQYYGYDEFDEVESPDSQAMEYLDKIVAECKENNVRVVFISLPQSRLYLSRVGDYDYFNKYITDYCNEKEVEYYDLNCVKSVIWQDGDFMDIDHLTLEGSEKLTHIISDIYNKEYPEMYNSIHDIPKQGIIGIMYSQEKIEGGDILTFDVQVDDDTDVSSLKYVIKMLRDKNVVYESPILEENSITLDRTDEKVMIEIYSKDGDYLYNARFQGIK